MGKIVNFVKWIFAKRVRAAVAIVIILIAVIAYSRSRNSNQNQAQTQTATAQIGNVISTVTASGTVLSSNFTPITTLESGNISNVYVKEGDSVYKGQRIATINLDEAGQLAYASAYKSLVSAQNSLYSAQNSYRSTQASLAVVYDEIKGHDTDETLTMKETRTKAEVANDNAYNGLKSAQAGLADAALSYKQYSPTITAPEAGVISSISVAPGLGISSSTDGTRIAVIKTDGFPMATFNVSEIDVANIEAGMKATITLDSISDKTFTGKVVSVDKFGTTTSGVTNYPVVIQFDTKPNDVLPNMAATANIITDSKENVLVVPSSAITTQNGTSTVSVMKNGQETTQTVQTGLTSDTETEITSGLSEGDVVVTGAISLSTGSTGSSRSVFSSFGGGGNARFIGR